MSAAAILDRETFTASRLLEFASVKELTAQTGHAPDDWQLVCVKELIDNGLDAAEEAGVPPVIRVTVARGRIRVRDNGRGILPETVASILDFASRTSSREAYVAPDRGRQGNALKCVLAMPFALSGESGRVEIAARGVRHEIGFRINRISQEPVVEHRQLEDASVRSGTSVTVWWPDSASSDLKDAGHHILPLVERFTDLNPHLDICATWVDDDLREQARHQPADPRFQKWTPSAPTCPHWYQVEHLEHLLGACLTLDATSGRERPVRDFLALFNGLTGTAKRKKVLAAAGLERAPLSRLLNGFDLDHGATGRLLAAMTAATRPIRPDKLGAIGADNIGEAFARYDGDPETFRYKAIKGVTTGVPWIAEAAFAFRPCASTRRMICGVNWSPTLKGGHDAFMLAGQLGDMHCGPYEPILLFAHLICPRPEFLDRGKAVLARTAPGRDAVHEAVRVVTEDWHKQRKREARSKSLEAKRLERMRARTVARVTLKEAFLEHLAEAIAKTSDKGRVSFSQRDLFYDLRPLVQAVQEKPLTYGYYTALITDYENEHGEIKGLQRDPRGSLYHPHLRQEIPLSTQSVAGYARPFWTFNKIVYIEKAGTKENLVEAGWPEEFDCAIASVAGFTTRAVKDLFDLLATSSEPVTVFCVHDADAAGTMIWHTLQNETKARGNRKIEVVNLGLEPWEGVELGLEVEPVEPIDNWRAVAPYVSEHDEAWRAWLRDRGFGCWSDWLQKFRIELNAMRPTDRVAWLTEKIEAHPPRKVVPPPDVLDRTRRGAAGLTLQFGGGELIGCTKGLEDDRCWFERHVGREHLIRKPIGGERVNFGRPPGRGLVRLIAVRQVRPGARIRVALFAPRGTLDSEANGRAAFELAHATHPWLAQAEQAWETLP